MLTTRCWICWMEQSTSGRQWKLRSRVAGTLFNWSRARSSDVTAGLGQGDYFYTEQDVGQQQRVFSGFQFWRDQFAVIDPDTLLPRGKVRGSVTNASAHDNSSKQFSVRFGDATVPDPLPCWTEQTYRKCAWRNQPVYRPDLSAGWNRELHLPENLPVFMYHGSPIQSIPTSFSKWRLRFRANNFTQIQPVVKSCSANVL